MIYGELRRFPLIICVKSRIISSLCNMVTMQISYLRKYSIIRLCYLIVNISSSTLLKLLLKRDLVTLGYPQIMLLMVI